MIRFATKHLDNYLNNKNRKPLVLRGARQVGKTWLIRDAAKRHNLNLIELNFERLPNLASLFSGNNPKEILENIEAEFSTSITSESSLLFLDEIQAAPEIFSKLRWFKEDMPELPVIAAGSLLEFALNDFKYSVPVGRITYLYIEAMSFFEFLIASGNDALLKKLISFELEKSIPLSLHEKCLELYQIFCLIGGMPEVVSEWVNSNNLRACVKIQHDLLATYRDDFNKYGGIFDSRLLSKIMLSVSEQLGNKFIYSRVDPTQKISPIKNALSLLSQAKVCSKVLYTTGNGLPLGAESNEKFFKALMLDIGLISVQLQLSSIKKSKVKELILLNKGGIAEQFVGQHLRFAQAPLIDPQLFYWQRTGGRLGEIDYIIQHENKVVPIEIKAGASGSMKSLHQFMLEKNLEFAVRFNTNLPQTENLDIKTNAGQPLKYRLLSLPVYLAEKIYEVIEQIS